MPMISIGMRNRVTGSGRPCGTMFFQCFTNPCAFVPAMMIEKNEIVASAAVTLKLPVAVTPPCVTLVRNESSAAWMTVWLSSASTSKIGMRPMTLAPRMNRNSVIRSGVQVSTHLSPTLGRTIDSLMKSTASFERVHEAGGHQPVLLQVAAHRQHHHHEDRGGDQPQHQDVLGDREVHAHDGGQVDERVLQRAVGDVLDDRRAGVEALGGGLAACSAACSGCIVTTTRSARSVPSPRTPVAGTPPPSRAAR